MNREEEKDSGRRYMIRIRTMPTTPWHLAYYCGLHRTAAEAIEAAKRKNIARTFEYRIREMDTGRTITGSVSLGGPEKQPTRTTR